MATSLVKFMNQRDGNGRGNLHWYRSEQDGFPFRGDIVPTMTSDEFESRLAQVADARNGFFNVLDAEENKAYIEVLDKIANNWAQLLHIERNVNAAELGLAPTDKPRCVHYIEWVEYYMEDGTAAQLKRPQG